MVGFGGFMRSAPRLLALAACAFALGLPVPPAGAAEFVVNVREDLLDAEPDDGVCDVDPSLPGIDYGLVDEERMEPILFRPCSLRAAVEEANRTAEADLIFVDANPAIPGPASTVVLSLKGIEDPAFPERTGDLDITSEMTITGEGLALSLVNGAALKDRIFDVHPSGTLTLERIGLVSGRVPKGDSDPGGVPGEASGGCVRSAGSTTLLGVFLVGCRSGYDGGCLSVIGGTASADGGIFARCRAKREGGALFVGEEASASIASVTAASNRAGVGGAVASRGLLDLVRSTLTSNKGKVGGSLAVLGESTATVRNSTIAYGRKTNLSREAGAALSLTNTIVTGAKLDCSEPVDSNGGNLESGSSCGLTGPNDQQNVDPMLSPLLFPLGSNLPSHGLLPGSPGIDHGIDGPDVCTETDAIGRQRLLTRETGGVAMTDTGAIEHDGPLFTFTTEPAPTATVGVPYVYDADAVHNRLCPLTLAFAVTQQPAGGGATIDPATGVMTWTPTAEQIGRQPMRIRAFDAADEEVFVVQLFAVEVSDAPAP
jgi:hypothetical protein